MMDATEIHFPFDRRGQVSSLKRDDRRRASGLQCNSPAGPDTRLGAAFKVVGRASHCLYAFRYQKDGRMGRSASTVNWPGEDKRRWQFLSRAKAWRGVGSFRERLAVADRKDGEVIA